MAVGQASFELDNVFLNYRSMGCNLVEKSRRYIVGLIAKTFFEWEPKRSLVGCTMVLSGLKEMHHRFNVKCRV